MDIISRSQWGARAWNGQPHSTPLSSRTHFLVHYHGGPPPNATGKWVPKNVEAIHLGNGWSGVGYNFLVDQDGRIYEGRGWGLVGAHCPGKNRTGIGVYVAVGGNQEPTDAAKAAVIALYSEANRKTGRTLTVGVHGDWYSTQCAGPKLTPWVHAGMPVRGGGAQDVDFEVPDVKPKPDTFTPLWTPTGKLNVREIQKIVGATVDGLYGSGTLEKVKDYQRDLGVTADGLWGKGTESAHFARERRAKRPRLRNLKRGSKGRRVRNLQAGLNRVFPSYSKLGVDGIYGPATQKVVKEFQRRSGIAADGIVGRNTRKELAKYGIKA